MPNWCDNYVLISGDEADLGRVRPELTAESLDAPEVEVREGGPGGLRALYSTRWTPADLSMLAARHPSVRVVHLWYEPNMTFRGYAV